MKTATQKTNRKYPLLLGATLLVSLLVQTPAMAQKQTLTFSGHEWEVKSGSALGPGPNAWEPANVWVDSKGWLHLKIARKDGKWTCAEVGTTKRFGFGTYEFQLVGRIDQLDRNVVLGLFNYPPRDVGTDATHEIDIEFARWGLENAPNGNYTVWPARKEAKQTSETFRFTLTDPNTTHRFHWQPQSLLFESLRGRGTKRTDLFQRWRFEPADFADRISQQPMPVLLNLWLFRGNAPTDGKEVEIILRRFQFTPAAADKK
jgi:hypothetical protein